MSKFSLHHKCYDDLHIFWLAEFDNRQLTDFNVVLSYQSIAYMLTVITFNLMLMTELHLVVSIQ